MMNTAETWQRSCIKIRNYRKYSSRKKESCTDSGSRMEERFKCILVPQVLQDFMIILAHDYSGHNGSRRTYNCLKRQYYWPGIRKQIFRHCKKCKECVLQNQGQPEKCFGHFDSPDLPMEFICMDLVGPIHPPSSRGNKYVLTVIDMLTGFTIAVPIKNKNAETICDAYRDNIYCVFGGSSRILTDKWIRV